MNYIDYFDILVGIVAVDMRAVGEFELKVETLRHKSGVHVCGSYDQSFLF